MRRQSTPPPALTYEDDWVRCMPDFRLTNIIDLVSNVNLSVVAETAAYLKRERFLVSHRMVVKRGNILEQRMIFDDMNERQARELRVCL